MINFDVPLPPSPCLPLMSSLQSEVSYTAGKKSMNYAFVFFLIILLCWFIKNTLIYPQAQSYPLSSHNHHYIKHQQLTKFN